MKVTPDQSFLEFNLENGYRYQENGNQSDTSTEFTRVYFKTFKKLFDLSILKKQQTNDSIFKNNYKMLSSRQLSRSIDSLEKSRNVMEEKFRENLDFYMHYYDLPDSLLKKNKSVAAGALNRLIPDSAVNFVKDRTLSAVNSLKNMLQYHQLDYDAKKKDIRLHKLEWHRKYSLSLACLILFFIGAPLGSIIRKGGLGMPLVTAIIFFLIFHLLNMFGEKFVKEAVLTPFSGMWLAIMVLTPVGIFLTYKAMYDSQLFNKEYYNRMIKKIRSFFPGRKKN